jgi:EamA domain-containing membrane protein RarD
MNPEFLRKLSLLDKTGVVGAILTALGWGIAGVFIKLLPNFSAFSIVAVRLALALVVIIPILLLQNDFFTQIRELRRLKVWVLRDLQRNKIPVILEKRNETLPISV